MDRNEAIQICKLLNALIELSQVEKILGTFITAFYKQSIQKEDGNYYLHSSFKLGGTVSGRMSSPLLMTIPSNSIYGKIIKKCFPSPKGMIYCGADFNSLESVINALITKDPNKLRPLIEGIDSHSFNAYGYYPHKFPGILNTALSLNTIPDLFPKERQASKPATFALQYQGTWTTLVNNCGIPMFDAKSIETNYHNLYQISDKWVQTRLIKATKDGYVTSAFGLRLRTPILHQCMLGEKNTPREAAAESRTAGNMIGGQAYCMMVLRAMIEFMQRVYDSEYKYEIQICASIHDAIYILCTDSIGCLSFVNKNLIECMQWCDLPELQHDIVKLGSELEVFYPDWSSPIGLKNNLTKKQILETVSIELKKRKENESNKHS
jgi:DNA polymerase-1